MNLAIMQPYFFPYLGYFQLISVSDTFVFYDDVQFIKGGWINRNRVLMNQSIVFINAIGEAVSPNKNINDIYLSSSLKWKDKLLKTIFFSYKKSSFFEEIYPFVEQLVGQDLDKLSDYNINALKEISRKLELKTRFLTSSVDLNNDHLNREARVIDICKYLGANQYINPYNGIGIYDKETFGKEHIDLKFIKMNGNLEYRQFDVPFVPNLSIIDVLMFNGFQGTREFLTKYSLV